MMEFLKVCCVFLLFGLAVSTTKNTGCPVLSIKPCTCTNDPFPVLVCDRLLQTTVLRQVFLNSTGIKYKVVRLTSPVLQYIPSDVFDNVEAEELQLINGTLVALFNIVPKDIPSLRTLRIENMRFMRSLKWEHIKPMTNLKSFSVYSSKFRVIGDDFAQYAPKSLEQITFYDTQTTKVREGVFEHFPNLDKLVIEHSRLKELKRNIFPVPFEGRFLSFGGNKIASISDDMFSNMPNLQTVSLRGNSLTTVPPQSFENLHFLDLEGNPLNCDCDLAWIVESDSLVLKGTCSSPDIYEGKDLREAYESMEC